MDDARGRALGDAAFRREAAHALSTPLGGLFLQADLIEYLLGLGKLDQARDAVATLLNDFEEYGQRFRSVFSALADIVEDGEGGSEPRTCLTQALSELGEVSAQIDYRGASPRVTMPPQALTALLRRLVMLALRTGAGVTAIVDVMEEDERCLLSLIVEGETSSDLNEPSFDFARGLDVRVAAEIAARHGGSVMAGTTAGMLALVVLPLETSA